MEDYLHTNINSLGYNIYVGFSPIDISSKLVQAGLLSSKVSHPEVHRFRFDYPSSEREKVISVLGTPAYSSSKDIFYIESHFVYGSQEEIPLDVLPEKHLHMHSHLEGRVVTHIKFLENTL